MDMDRREFLKRGAAAVVTASPAASVAACATGPLNNSQLKERPPIVNQQKYKIEDLDFSALPQKLDGVPKGPLFLIITSKQVAGLYYDGALQKPMPSSTGQPGYPTQPGVYRVLNKYRFHNSNLYPLDTSIQAENLTKDRDEDKIWSMEYTLKFDTDGKAIHASHNLEDGKPYFIAGNSHGCAGLRKSEAVEIFRAMNIGDTVVVLDAPPQSGNMGPLIELAKQKVRPRLL